jgi:hypothetical protein
MFFLGFILMFIGTRLMVNLIFLSKMRIDVVDNETKNSVKYIAFFISLIGYLLMSS